MPVFKIQQVEVETVTKGRSSYEVANVVYTTRTGENKEKKVMSFSNPAVFGVVKKLGPGTEVEVSYADGDKYYNWAKVEVVGASAPEASPKAATPGKVLGSTYETAEERKLRQLHIVRQSSLANAISLVTSTSKAGGERPQVEEVLTIAQEFVDFVYGNTFEEPAQEDDVPY